MSHYTQQECDFVERTKKIIEQYDSLNLPEEDKFEVTLLLNCLVGLLILPQQYWYDRLSTTLINGNDWGIAPEHITFIKQSETKSIKNIGRHLRNAVSHYKFTAYKNSSNKINEIKFEDFNQNRIKTFEAHIPLANLRKFIYKLTEEFISDIRRHK